jgi:predicted transposase/invertase (TIGR01784 family)
VSRYLDPKADIVFKRIFLEHPHLLKSFLNAVLPLPSDRPIVELTCLPQELVPKIPALKKTIADVHCTDSEGRSFIVEMQIEWTDSFKQRLLFEAGQAFVKQLDKGEGYHLLEPVYGLGLIASTFDPSDCWYHHYQLVNIGKPSDKEIIEHLQLIFIELPKFPVSSPEEKQLRLLWLRFMREINDKTKEAPKELLAVPEISEALKLAEESAYSSNQLLAYESYWDGISIEKTLIAEHAAKGIAQGRIEERFFIAHSMKANGLSTAVIAQCTGLSELEIQSL